jgi:hypothetical protein
MWYHCCDKRLIAVRLPNLNSRKRLALKPKLDPELVVSLIVNNKEPLLRALADTGASRSIILEAYTSAPFIKTDDSNTTT